MRHQPKAIRLTPTVATRQTLHPKFLQLIGHGYLPDHIPPCFSSRAWAAALASGSNSAIFSKMEATARIAPVSRADIHKVARPGKNRRLLSLVAPEHFFSLALDLCDNEASIFDKSNISLTAPLWADSPYSNTDRAIKWRVEQRSCDSVRAISRAGSNYVVIADIRGFYGSIYTHALAWAIEGKSAAKARRNDPTMLGNRIDKLVRGGQSGEPIGIPIGPDTSHLIAEKIACVIDRAIIAEAPIASAGNRIIDDYEFPTKTHQDAEVVLSTLQGILSEYRLELNDSKTRIIEAPPPTSDRWTGALRRLVISEDRRTQEADLIDFFSEAMALRDAQPSSGVLRYAIRRLTGEKIDTNNQKLFQSLLWQCAAVEPGTVSDVVNDLIRRKSDGWLIDLDLASKATSSIVQSHLRADHGSEVLWSLYSSQVISHPLSVDLESVLTHSVDPFVITMIVSMAFRDGHLSLTKERVVEILESRGGDDELPWLPLFELLRLSKGDCPKAVRDRVMAHPFLKLLAESGVSFIDEASLMSPIAVANEEYSDM